MCITLLLLSVVTLVKHEKQNDGTNAKCFIMN